MITSFLDNKDVVAANRQAFDLLVDIGLFFDVEVVPGDIGLRLVVIVIGDKICHCVFRKEFLELRIKLGDQGLVMGDDQGGFVDVLDDVRHSKGLAGTGGTQQNLVLITLFQYLRSIERWLRAGHRSVGRERLV